MTRAAAATGVSTSAVCLLAVAGGCFGVWVCRPGLRLVVRSVRVPSAAMHEEHRQRAGEDEKKQDQRCRAHPVPPFVSLAFSFDRAGEGRVKRV
jgi:Zn-finger nucleic acid-binding protein